MLDKAQFAALVTELLSSDNDARKRAEATLKELRSDANGLVGALVQTLRDAGAPEQSRVMCCAVLRPAIVKSDSLWPALAPETREWTKRELLAAIETERAPTVLRKLADCVSDIGAFLTADGRGGWPELLQTTLRLTGSADPVHRETALGIFAQLAVLYGAEVFRPHFELIKGVLQQGLSDGASLKVRLAALVATASFLQIMEKQDDAHLNQFRALLPQMLECISAAIQQHQEKEAQMALEVFVEIAETASTFFKPFLHIVASTMLQIIQATQLQDETRRFGFEVIICLCESRAGLMKKMENFVPTMIKLMLSWMVTVEDLEEWYNFQDEDNTPDHEIAEQALDRLCLALHGKVIVPELFGHINTLMRSEDWRHRYAAVVAMSISFEGCNKVLLSHLGEIVRNIATLANDPHPRVRYAVLSCVGQLCNDFGPMVQEQHAAVIVPIITNAMKDTVVRVQANATVCIINFVCSADAEVTIPHLPVFLDAIRQVLQSPSLKVQENAITAITSIADHVDSAFTPYYDFFVPYLKTVVQRAKEKQYRNLRGKVMECLSLIGVAVGKEVFAKDAVEVMTEMMNTQVVEADDPQIGFLETAFSRLAECLGTDFVPFLPVVMPSALHRATMKADIQIFDTANKPKEGWDVINLGEKTLGVHTAQLEEKASAMHTLACYAANLGPGFLPYVQQVAEVAIAHLGFYFNEGVRDSAYSSFPFLLKSVIESVKAGAAPKDLVSSMWNAIFEAVRMAMPEEPDLDTRLTAVTSFTECFNTIAQPCLDAQQMRDVADMLKTMLNEWMAQKDAIIARSKQDDFDDEEAEKLEDTENVAIQVLEGLADLTGRVARIHGDAFYQPFQEFLQPVVLAMIAPARSEEEHQRGLCIYDDMIESSKVAAAAYMPQYIPAMLQYATDRSSVVRQAAVYGLGVAAQALGDAFAPVLPQVLAKLREVISAPDAFEDENAHPTENAISSIARIAISHASRVNAPELVSFVVSLLPLSHDAVEARALHDMVLGFAEQYPDAVFGPGLSNAPRFVAAMARVVDTRFLSTAGAPRVAALIRQLSTQIPATAFAGMEPKYAERLQQFLAKHP